MPQCSPARQLIDGLHLIGVERVRGRNSKSSPLATCEAADRWLSMIGSPFLEPSGDGELRLAYECLAWANELPWLPSALSEATWWNLLGGILQVTEQADFGQVDCPLAAQLLTGELPFLLANSLPEIDACYSLAAPAQEMMSRTLLQMLGDDGLPHASQLRLYRPLMASWTRCQLLTAAHIDEDGEAHERRSPSMHLVEGGNFDEPAQEQYEQAAEQLLRLARRDGRQVLTQGIEGHWCEPLFAAMLSLASRGCEQAVARETLPKGKKLWPAADEASQSKPCQIADFPPSVCSEWSGLLSMRTHWKRSSPHWAARFDEPRIEIELSRGKETICQGDWPLEVEVNGQLLEPTSSWTENCWYQDSDVAYLELEMRLSSDWCVQRQMLLAEDEFLFLADAVLREAPSQESEPVSIRYSGMLPILESIVFKPAEETRDGILAGKKNKPLAIALPLALPEWRIEKSAGELANTVDGLQLEMHNHGLALYAPLFLDLAPSRLKREPTWRRLTVASQLKAEPIDRAAAYRIEIGGKQWIIYRSLGKPASRTVLGRNLVSEFLCARFDRHGDTETIIEIE